MTSSGSYLLMLRLSIRIKKATRNPPAKKSSFHLWKVIGGIAPFLQLAGDWCGWKSFALLVVDYCLLKFMYGI
jgi:hypothetical protein